MYTLYGMTGSCSMAVHTLLNELAVPFEVIDVRVPEGQPKPADFLKLNPRGSVPVLVDDGHRIREGGAILAYLLDKHNSPMLPQSGPARATALEWLAFANATMHPLYSRVFFTLRALKNPEGQAESLNATIESINKMWADVDAQLAKTAFVCGDSCSAADILLAVIANWGQGGFAKQIVLGDNVKRMLAAVTARPAFQKTLADERIKYHAC